MTAINLKMEIDKLDKIELIKKHLNLVYKHLNNSDLKQIKDIHISYFNYMNRSHLSKSQIIKYIKSGSIVYCDFGDAYLHESAFLHMGLVLTLYREKAFIIPMTSKLNLVDKYRKIGYKDHLYYIGKIAGLSKESVLFLNDAKFINSARIIDVKGYMDVNSHDYQKIKSFYQSLFDY